MLTLEKFRKPIAAYGVVPQFRYITFYELQLPAEGFHLDEHLVELDRGVGDERIARNELNGWPRPRRLKRLSFHEIIMQRR